MTNFIFKSQKTSTYKKLVNQLLIVQSELRHQRVEHAEIIALLVKLTRDKNLQKQVDDFYVDVPPTPQEEEDAEPD